MSSAFRTPSCRPATDLDAIGGSGRVPLALAYLTTPGQRRCKDAQNPLRIPIGKASQSVVVSLCEHGVDILF